MTGNNGASATNNFAGAQVLAISIEIDEALLTTGGDHLSVWASTHRR